MKKKLYRITGKRRKSWHGHSPRKDGPEPVHSRYHRRIAPAHDRKKAA